MFACTLQNYPFHYRFRGGKEKVLVTTNLCARGIDVEQVTVVVNYDIPIDVNKRPDCETYLHRYNYTQFLCYSLQCSLNCFVGLDVQADLAALG